MQLFLLAIYILYCLAIFVRSLKFIDHNRVEVADLKKVVIRVLFIPLFGVVALYLKNLGMTTPVLVIGWGLYILLPYVVRLVIYLIVFFCRDKDNADQPL